MLGRPRAASEVKRIAGRSQHTPCGRRSTFASSKVMEPEPRSQSTSANGCYPERAGVGRLLRLLQAASTSSAWGA